MKKMKDLPLKLFEVYQYDKLIMQLGLGMTLFFPRPFSAIKKAVWDLWQQYLLLVGKESFTWSRLGGGNRSRSVTPSTFQTIEAWLTGKKDYGSTCWISIHDGPMDSLGQHSFLLEGLEEPNDDDEDVGFLELALPVAMLDSLGPVLLADKLVALAAKVPFYSGFAGFVFHRSPYKFDDTIGKMAALSSRFEGVSVSANERMQYWAGKGLTAINWITFVGDELINRLGSQAALAKKLPPDSSTVELDYGVAIRAGDAPLLGDKNSGRDELTLWRKVYKVLKPIQFVDTIYEFDPFEFDGERTAKWLQRLDS